MTLKERLAKSEDLGPDSPLISNPGLKNHIPESRSGSFSRGKRICATADMDVESALQSVVHLCHPFNGGKRCEEYV
ncbi:MAG: hypothetical protein ACLP05_03945 [Candidatus Kryptoniota bacterium]